MIHRCTELIRLVVANNTLRNEDWIMNSLRVGIVSFLELESSMPSEAKSYLDLLLTRAHWDRETARNWAIKNTTFWQSMGYLWADEPDERLAWALGCWNCMGHDGEMPPIVV